MKTRAIIDIGKRDKENFNCEKKNPHWIGYSDGGFL